MSEEEEVTASVSSLRSRFEQLSSTQKNAAPTASTPETSRSQTQQQLRPCRTGSDPFGDHRPARQSLEIPREVAYEPSPVASTVPRVGGANAARPRPLSVFSTFSRPQSPPTFRVESPRSPPKRSPERPSRLQTQQDVKPHAGALQMPSPNGSTTFRQASPSPTRSGKTPPPPPSPRGSRPPLVQAAPEVPDRRQSLQIEPGRRTPRTPSYQEQPHANGNGVDRGPARSPAPPIPHRMSKPKISTNSTKPPVPKRDGSCLTTPLVTPSEERMASPFNSPPQSSNDPSGIRSPPPPERPLEQARKLSAPTHHFLPPPTHHAVADSRRDRNEFGLAPPTRQNTAPLPPPRMSMDTVRPRMRPEDSIKATRMSLDETARPQLPPRPPGGGLIGGVRARMTNRGRSHSPPGGSGSTSAPPGTSNFLPPPRREGPTIKARSPIRGDRNTSGASTTSSIFSIRAPSSRYGPDDSDEDVGDDQGLSDFPDSSQANRRRPYFKDDLHEIPCRTDVRLFAVSGQYVCTISHSTKVWDVMSGQCIMSMQHAEGERVTALAFKPTARVEDEGTVLWLGTSQGELQEVDISRQVITDTRTSAHMKQQIIKIHRCGYSLWSLDEGGKLQVWSPDINGEPNLKNSPTTFRTPARHTCSIVVDDLLWVGSQRSVDVYQPSTDPSKVFNVLTRPINPVKPAGEITCCAVVNSQPEKVYFGHLDGKVSVYSRKSFQCLDVVSVSLYKINTMSGVGDYLWAGFKTGMMYVYDVQTKPWRALKDWQCADGPVMEVVADRTSIWKNGRLQVVSLGTDNIIRLWDGMLEDDWMEAEMQKHDLEFCSFREIKALVCTWNAGASKPQDLFTRQDDAQWLQDCLGAVDSPDIIVFGFQELVDLEDKKITAKYFQKLFLNGGKNKVDDKQEQMSTQYRLWQQQLTRAIETHMPPSEPYVLLHAANLVGLFSCIFIKASERGSIRNVCASSVKRGLGGLHGNKGALIIRFLLDDSSLCFINCHLAAGQSHTISRNNDIAAILESGTLPPEPSATSRSDLFVGGGDGSMILDHEICILNGDLNYRIDVSRETAVHRVKMNDLATLLEKDQLLVERKRNPGFRLRAFTESPLCFAPTYKYDVNSDTYDSSEKKRVPAWCDRILYRGLGRIKQTEYRRWEVHASDHRPVSANFLVRLKTVVPEKRKRVWKECVARYEEVRQRHEWEAKMDFLVFCCGYDPQQAQKTLGRKFEVGAAVESLQAQEAGAAR